MYILFQLLSLNIMTNIVDLRVLNYIYMYNYLCFSDKALNCAAAQIYIYIHVHKNEVMALSCDGDISN
jgi:hypothetical protein